MGMEETPVDKATENSAARKRFGLALALFCLCLFLFRSWICKDGPVTWDEPVYLNASQSYANWGVEALKSIFHGDFLQSFSKEKIEESWHRHLPSPPLAKIFNGITWIFFRGILGDLAALRAGSAIAYCVLFGFVVWIAYGTFGPTGAFISALGLLINPRLFSHAGTANLDTTGMVLAFFSLVYFWRTADKKGWKVTLTAGVLWGAALSAKNSALLMLPLFFLWALLWRRKGFLLLRLVLMQLIAPLVFFILWPWLYHDTAQNFSEFSRWAGITGLYEKAGSVFQSNETNTDVDRKLIKRFGASSSGIRSGDKASFPWYYALAVIGVVIPVPTLILFIVGTFLSLRQWRSPTRTFFVLGAWYPLLVTALPFIPVYDMERFLLISMPFMALVCGAVAPLIAARLATSRMKLAACLVISLCYAPAVKEWIYVHPVEFSYYNAVPGGLVGAVEKGFPRNYWLQSHWGALPYLNAQLPQGAALACEEIGVIKTYQTFGLLRPDIVPCKITNAASAERCDYFLRTEPIRDEVRARTHIVYTFSLHGVPLSSIHDVTSEYLQMRRDNEREKRREKRQKEKQLSGASQ